MMNPRLLLIEPDGLIQRFEQLLWRSQQAEVDIAINGDRALELANRHLYDVVVVNPELEDGFDGFEAILAIKHHTINHQVPFMLVTSNETLSYLSQAIELDINWYMIRPLNKAITRAAMNWIKEPKPRPSCLIVHNRHLIAS